MDPKVSVIIPVYKVEEYLDECVKSVVLQTYDNIEILLVDDGSPDKCPEMCDRYSLEDSRIKTFHKKNGGLSSARNYGIENATGQYLFFVDSDDYLDHDVIKKLVEDIQEKDADISVAKISTKEDDVIEPFDTQSDYIRSATPCISGNEYLSLILRGAIENAAWNKLYRRNLFDNVRFREGRNNEDFLMFFELCRIANAVSFIDYYGYYYRQRANSIVHDLNTLLYVDIIKNIEEVKTEIIKYNLPYLNDISIKEAKERISVLKILLKRRLVCKHLPLFIKNYCYLWNIKYSTKENLPNDYQKWLLVLKYMPILYYFKKN